MSGVKEPEWSALIRECLDSTTIAVLATNSGSVWAAPLYFSYDDKFNIYFISPESTRHMKDIAKDPRVALVVFMPVSAAGVYQIGVQIEGRASEVPDKDIEYVYSIRTKRMNGDISWAPEPKEGHFVKEHGGVFMKVEPTSVNYVDTRHFGGSSVKVPIPKLLSGK